MKTENMSTSNQATLHYSLFFSVAPIALACWSSLGSFSWRRAMSDVGLPPAMQAIGVMMLACGLVGALTNRTFGHPTFFRNPVKTAAATAAAANNRSTVGRNSNTPQPRLTKTQDFRRGVSVAAASFAASATSARDRVRFDLPPCALENVSSFLSPADLVGVASVCSDFRAASESEFLWKAHCFRAFGEEAKESCGVPQRKQEEGGGGASQEEEEEEKAIVRWLERGERMPLETGAGGGGDSSVEMRGPTISTMNSAADRRRPQHWQPRRRQRQAVPPATDSTERPRERDALDGITISDDRPVRDFDQAAAPTAAAEVTSDSSGREEGPCCGQNNSSNNYSSSSLRNRSSWREFFFLAHHARPKQLLANAPPSSCVVLVGARVHDLTDFLLDHPGGAMILREHASMDATREFERFFHSREARRIAQQFVIWDGIAMMGRRGTLVKVAASACRVGVSRGLTSA